MSRLLTAELIRMTKDKVFHRILILIGISCVIVAGFIALDYAQRPTTKPPHMEFLLYTYFFIAGMILSILESFFVGVKFTERTINNQLICGYTKEEVYASSLLTCSTTAIAIQLFFLMLMTILQYVLFGSYQVTMQEILIMQCKGIFISLSYTSLMHFLVMQTRKTADAVVLTLLFSIMILVVSIYVHTKLYPAIGITSLSEREIIGFKILDYGLPSGQAISLSDAEHDPALWMYAVCCAGMMALTNFFGISIFRKKDLN